MKKPYRVIIVGIAVLTGLCAAFYSASALSVDDMTIDNHFLSTADIDLFDYWVEGANADDNTTPRGFASMGINQNSPFLFSGMYNQNGANAGVVNLFSGSSKPHFGIVGNQLVNGSPQTAIADNAFTGDIAGRRNVSLAYLFDDQVANQYRTSYTGVRGLLRHSQSRGDYFNARESFAEYDQGTNSFRLFRAPNGANAWQPSMQFFPFNKYSALTKVDGGAITANDVKTSDAQINHHFGLTMASEFGQLKDGLYKDEQTGELKHSTALFSGDDDMWVYADGVLMIDMGGIHGAASAKVDYATGKVTITSESDASQVYDSYFIGDKYAAVKDEAYMAKNFIKETNAKGEVTRYTFADGTRHSLKLYYLERGGNMSDLKMEFLPVLGGQVTNPDDHIDIPTTDVDNNKPVVDPPVGNNNGNSRVDIIAPQTGWRARLNKETTAIVIAVGLAGLATCTVAVAAANRSAKKRKDR